jgi:hypothetical protein
MRKTTTVQYCSAQKILKRRKNIRSSITVHGGRGCQFKFFLRVGIFEYYSTTTVAGMHYVLNQSVAERKRI